MNNDIKNAIFDKSKFYAARAFYHLLLCSDFVKNTVDLIHKEGGRI